MKCMAYRQNGYALATILVLMGVALFGVGAIVTVATLSTKITRSQQEGVNAYYVAEAGLSDAMWRINNVQANVDALQANNLNLSYSAANAPRTGSSFTVRAVSNTTRGAGYATITVSAAVDNGTFIARRQLIVDVFQGMQPVPLPFHNAITTGSQLNATNGSGVLTVVSGDLYSNNNMILNKSVIVAPNSWMLVQGNYQPSSPPPVVLGVKNPPPTPLQVPGFSIQSYCSDPTAVSLTSTQFANQVRNNATFGAITCVSGTTNLNRVTGNITVNGMLIFTTQSFSVQNSPNFSITVNCPASNKCGIFSAKSLSFSSGRFTVNGILYAANQISLSGLTTGVFNGGFIAGGNVDINPGANGITLTTVPAYQDSTLISGSIPVLQQDHWEEEY